MSPEPTETEDAEAERLPYVAWDTCDIAQHQANHLREEDPGLSEEDALHQAHGDQDLYDHEWEWVVDSLTEKMKEIGEEGFWHVSIDDFGWRDISMRGVFEADDGKAFLSKVLPDCDCTFQIFVRDADAGKMFYIRNWHHDSPMGESYYVHPISEAKFHGEEEEEEEDVSRS